MLVGNKVDREVERKISNEDAMSLATKHQMNYFETSSTKNVGVNIML